MEMLGSVVGSIISSMAEYSNYHKDADEHVKNLQRKWEVLESRKEDIESRLEAELRRGKKQKKEVELWLGEVLKIKDEINIEQVPARWKFLSRMRMGECASKKIGEMEELYQRSVFIDSLVVDPPPFNVIQLQYDISRKLDLDLTKVWDVRERAAKLKAKLEDKKRFVLILDDMWEAFPLEKVGIPEPTLIKWMQINLKAIAEDVLERCAQLPLAIVTIAARLGGCWNFKACAFISQAYKIKEVRPRENRIMEVPDGLEMLVNLRYLDLNAKNLKIMPPEILPKLSHLQYLLVFSEVKWEEVASLKNLETFGGLFSNMYEYSKYIRSLENGRLATYEIQVGRPENILLAQLPGAKRKEKDASAQVPPHTFSRLKRIYIYQCGKLKKLLTAWVAATPAQPGRD
uniref:NB-ARC domain-containing protein n=1 Tax=Fagus sylvatica TaxID=28930 RepID=A0A2N9ESY2_FAGSY